MLNSSLWLGCSEWPVWGIKLGCREPAGGLLQKPSEGFSPREWGDECSCEGEGPDDSESGPLSTGEHRGLGAGISKVRSLKMDRKVWTETLIEVGRPLLATCI